MLVYAAAKDYGCRVSDMIDPHHALDDLVRLDIDVAISLRARVEENEAYRKAREEAEKDKPGDEGEDSGGDGGDFLRKTRQPVKSTQPRSARGKGKVQKGMTAGEIAEFEAAGGKMPKKGEKDDVVERYIQERQERMNKRLKEKEAERLERAVGAAPRILQLHRQSEAIAHKRRQQLEGQP